MRESEIFRHIHSSTYDLDICSRFTLSRGFHRSVEFAKSFDAGRYPVTTSQRPRQICITPFSQVVVAPIWVWLQCPLHPIAVVVENEDDRIGSVASHISDLVGGQLMTAVASDEDRTPA